MRWTAESGTVGLGGFLIDPPDYPNCPDSGIAVSSAAAVSGDGAVVVGQSLQDTTALSGLFNPYCVFSRAGGFTLEGHERLGLSAASDQVIDSTARAVSADGSVIVGDANTGPGGDGQNVAAVLLPGGFESLGLGAGTATDV